ncbi:MAG: hypothetical protein U0Q16_36530 [Bryobacteraceae bacterium]
MPALIGRSFVTGADDRGVIDFDLIVSDTRNPSQRSQRSGQTRAGGGIVQILAPFPNPEDGDLSLFLEGKPEAPPANNPLRQQQKN